MCVVIGVVAPCASVWYDVESYMHRTMMLSASMSCNEQRGGVRFTCALDARPPDVNVVFDIVAG